MIKVLLIFLIACFGYSDYFTGKSLQTRPLVLGPLVGLVMGDMQAGCVIGATMELALMGAVGVGAALPPEVVSGGILGTAFAIAGHKDAGMAVALGLPIAMLVMLLRNFLFIVIVPLFANRADKYAEQGDIKGVSRMHWFGGIFGMYLPMAILVAVAYYLLSRKWSDGNGIECYSAICSGWAHNFSGNPSGTWICNSAKNDFEQEDCSIFSNWICNDCIFRAPGTWCGYYGG